MRWHWIYTSQEAAALQTILQVETKDVMNMHDRYQNKKKENYFFVFSTNITESGKFNLRCLKIDIKEIKQNTISHLKNKVTFGLHGEK